ncbi:MAG: hypothetical protein E7545_00005, partial [Ruminococcaceae bacterium]|nr:hypothetical protein [Oscillospiraceae bacterium]
MKKIISLVLTVCMLFTMVYAACVTASAATTASTTVEDIAVDLSKLYRIGTDITANMENLTDGGVNITVSNYTQQIFGSDGKIPSSALWMGGAIFAVKDDSDNYIILQTGYEYVINIMYDVTAVGTTDTYYQPQIGLARNNHSGNPDQDNGTVIYTAQKRSSIGSYSITYRTTPNGTQPLRLAFGGHGTFNIKSMSIKKVIKTASSAVNMDLTNVEPITVTNPSYSNLTPATEETPFSIDVNATYAYNGTLFDGTNTWLNTWTVMYLKTLIPLKLDAENCLVATQAKNYTIKVEYKVNATSATATKDYPEIGIVYNNGSSTTADNGSKVIAAQRINPTDVGVKKTLTTTVNGISNNNRPLRLALTGKGTFEISSITITETTNAIAITFVDDGVSTFDCIVSGEALPTPEKTGYSFEGWYSNADFTGAKVEKASANDSTLYAKWVAVCTHENKKDEIIEAATYFTTGLKNIVCDDCNEPLEQGVVIPCDTANPVKFGTPVLNPETNELTVNWKYSDALATDIAKATNKAVKVILVFDEKEYDITLNTVGSLEETLTLQGVNAERFNAEFSVKLEFTVDSYDTATLNAVAKSAAVKVSDTLDSTNEKAEAYNKLIEEIGKVENAVVAGEGTGNDDFTAGASKVDIANGKAEIKFVATKALIDELKGKADYNGTRTT